MNDDFSAYIQADVASIKGLIGQDAGANAVYMGGDFTINDSSNLKGAVSFAPDSGKDNKQTATGIRLAYTQKLGDNVTGSLSFDTALGGDGGGNLFADERIGWKLAFA